MYRKNKTEGIHTIFLMCMQILCVSSSPSARGLLITRFQINKNKNICIWTNFQIFYFEIYSIIVYICH